jgi:hypothetical protein
LLLDKTAEQLAGSNGYDPTGSDALTGVPPATVVQPAFVTERPATDVLAENVRYPAPWMIVPVTVTGAAAGVIVR